MEAAVRWWESPHRQPRMVRLGMAVRSACFAAAVTLGQAARWSVVRAGRLLSVTTLSLRVGPRSSRCGSR
jgi:hypothetical protein